MRRTTLFPVALIMVIFGSGSVADNRTTAEELPSVRVSNSAASARIDAALQQDSQLQVVETPLVEVVEFLKDSAGIPIVMDTNAIKNSRIDLDTPITVNLRGISLRSLLRITLSEVGLTFVSTDGVLLVTTPVVARQHQVIRIYNVKALMGDEKDASAVAAAISSAMEWPSAGGGFGGEGGGGFFSVADQFGPAGAPGGPFLQGRLVPFRHLLIIRETSENHHAVGELLDALTRALRVDSKQP